ncbi:MAG: NAD(P)H-hydrate dehydratase [Firmicutes bacterium]|nr:NAD(P)H-hydrate dehydratase [Bacillota bacterium]
MDVVTAAEMRAMDAAAIDEYGLLGVILMENAGLRLADTIRQGAYGHRVIIVAGRGNNGGDGFVVARHLHKEKDVAVWTCNRAEEYSGNALINLNVLHNLGIPIHCLCDEGVGIAFAEALQNADLVVDAIFGTGLTRTVSGIYQEVINTINKCRTPVLAVDIPSGVCADTGQVLGVAVQAAVTVTFALPKLGHYLHPGATHRGRLHVVEIGIPPALLTHHAVTLLSSAFVRNLLPDRPADGHKGSFGTVLLVAGSANMSGAAALAAVAALRGGCGLLYAAVPSTIQATVATQVTEAITIPLPVTTDGKMQSAAIEVLRQYWSSCQVIAIGPGLTQSTTLLPLMAGILQECDVPVVLDADALTLLAQSPEILRNRQATTVLTPHPGEAARLLGQSVAQIQADRMACARELATRFSSTVVLKGAYSIIADPQGTASINTTGNSGMATAGSGDVLTGLVASLLAQGLAVAHATRLAVHLHGLAGDLAAVTTGEPSLLARDVINHIPKAYLEIGKIHI